MSMGTGGPPWRHLRSDRSVVDNKIERRTVRRVLGFARPAPAADRGRSSPSRWSTPRSSSSPPLLLKMIIDDGVSSGDTSLVVWLAAAWSRSSRSSTPASA